MMKMAARMSIRTLKILGFLMGAFGLLLLIFPYYILGPEAYIPKSNPEMGYFLPKYLEAWIMLILALILLIFSMILLAIYVYRRQHMRIIQQTRNRF